MGNCTRIHYYRVDLNKPMFRQSYGVLGEGDDDGDVFVFSLVRNGAVLALTSAVLVTGYFVRPDGNTVILKGEIADNKASITLPQSCYVKEGRSALTVKATIDGATTTIAMLDGFVRQTTTDAVVDPGTFYPSLEDLLNGNGGGSGGGGGGSVAVDATLTMAGMAADAKATGDKIATLSEKIVAKVEDKKYRHSNLDVDEVLTIYSDDRYDHAPHVFLGKNFWPDTKYLSNSRYMFYGLSFNTDGHNITVKGASTGGSSFKLVPEGSNDEYWPLPAGLSVGDAVDLHVFSDKRTENKRPSVGLRIYDASKAQLLRINCTQTDGEDYAVKANQVIPVGATYIVYELSFGNGNDYDRTVHPVLVKSATRVISDLAFDNDVCSFMLPNASDDVYTAPYPSSAEQELTFSKYIEERGISEETLNAAIVSPEMFGAYADNVHDDSAAIQACIDYAKATNKKVVGGGLYATAFPISITGSYNVVEISKLYYKGADCALIISGSHNKVTIQHMYCDAGAGYRLISDVDCTFNDVYVGYINTSKNGVEYIATSGSIVSNRLTFNRIYVTGVGDCIYQTGEDALPVGKNHGNNTFVGGLLSGGNWAVYGAKGRDAYMTVRMEGVANGIYNDSVGTVRVIAPRYAELKMNDNGGVVFSLHPTHAARERNNGTRETLFALEANDGYLTPPNFDFTGAFVEFINTITGEVEVLSKSYPGAKKIYAELMTRHTKKIADSFLQFGNHILISEPAFKCKKHISTEDVGYVGDYTVTGNDDEFDIYDEFIVDASGCNYTLPPSYDLIAFNRFWVDQPEGTSCTLRDWRGTVVFDGASLGAGRYEVSVRLADDMNQDYYDNRNQVWDIYKDGALVATMPQATT